MNYYNEFDPHAAAWLRELITAGLIPPGEVDERSIVEVEPVDLVGFTQCHFFCGVAGWSLTLHLAGWGADRPVWTASLPCQPFSVAGKRKGSKDERHLWPVFAELVRACEPATIFGEQVASADGRAWLAGVFADLEGMGYQRAGADLCAAGVGAPHIRQRLYWVAHTLRAGRAEWWAEPGNRQVAGRGELGGMAYAGSQPAGRGLREPGESIAAIGERASDKSSGSSGIGGLAIAASPRREGGESKSARDEFAALERSGIAGGLGDSTSVYQFRPREPEPSVRRAGAVRGSGAWSNFGIIPCADGKARRIESGTFPLVDGLPKGMVSSSDPSLQEVQATAEARVMRLKGFGNAIIPQLAAEFISAFLEAIEELHGY